MLSCFKEIFWQVFKLLIAFIILIDFFMSFEIFFQKTFKLERIMRGGWKHGCGKVLLLSLAGKNYKISELYLQKCENFCWNQFVKT